MKAEVEAVEYCLNRRRMGCGLDIVAGFCAGARVWGVVMVESSWYLSQIPY